MIGAGRKQYVVIGILIMEAVLFFQQFDSHHPRYEQVGTIRNQHRYTGTGCDADSIGPDIFGLQNGFNR